MEENQAVNDVQENKPLEDKVHHFSEAELQALLQSEGDKRINSARSKMQADIRKQVEADFNKERAEAEKLAQMNADERIKFELDKERESFNTEREQFETMKHEFEMQRLQLELVKTLEGEGIPTQFSSFLIADNAEAVKENVNNFKQMFFGMIQEQVEAKVKEALKGNAPSKGTDTKTMTRQEFLRLPYAERMKMMENDREFVEKLLSN